MDKTTGIIASNKGRLFSRMGIIINETANAKPYKKAEQN